jgi:hypothetical protein
MTKYHQTPVEGANIQLACFLRAPVEGAGVGGVVQWEDGPQFVLGDRSETMNQQGPQVARSPLLLMR